MKIFWSWQSDTPGKIGRHFVRECLEAAIEALKQPNQIEEPGEKDRREALHLDHDRKGRTGSPDLAATIFEKIEAAAVFICDVTLVGETIPIASNKGGKKLINSNVAIEYGHAHHALTDAKILFVQNIFFGDRASLPFDLKHKAGPIEFSLSPEASKDEISKASANLTEIFIQALRPYLDQSGSPKASSFQEIPATYTSAFFFNPPDVLASNNAPPPDDIEYRFAGSPVLYLRLVPTKPLAQPHKLTDLHKLALDRKIDVLSRHQYVSSAGRNRFGVIAYEPSGTARSPRSFTQAFTNGEFWAVGTDFFQPRNDLLIIATKNIENVVGRVLDSLCKLARSVGVEPPYQIEIGVVGIAGIRLGTSFDEISDVIHSGELKLRRIIHEPLEAASKEIIETFLEQLYDLAGETRERSK